MDLQTLALLAAAIDTSLRPHLDPTLFGSQHRELIEALKDGRKRQSREVVRKWLQTLGVTWEPDTHGDARPMSISAAVVQSWQQQSLLAAKVKAARVALSQAEWTLRFPGIAGAHAVERSLAMADDVLKRLENGPANEAQPTEPPQQDEQQASREPGATG